MGKRGKKIKIWVFEILKSLSMTKAFCSKAHLQHSKASDCFFLFVFFV